jgi:hypothetical protein
MQYRYFSTGPPLTAFSSASINQSSNQGGGAPRTSTKHPRTEKQEYRIVSFITMAATPTFAQLPPEESGNEAVHEATAAANNNSNNSVATLSSPWQFDDLEETCKSCKGEFNPFNRRHHCRLCGRIFCNDCSNQR